MKQKINPIVPELAVYQQDLDRYIDYINEFRLRYPSDKTTFFEFVNECQKAGEIHETNLRVLVYVEVKSNLSTINQFYCIVKPDYQSYDWLDSHFNPPNGMPLFSGLQVYKQYPDIILPSGKKHIDHYFSVANTPNLTCRVVYWLKNTNQIVQTEIKNITEFVYLYPLPDLTKQIVFESDTDGTGLNYDVFDVLELHFNQDFEIPPYNFGISVETTYNPNNKH